LAHARRRFIDAFLGDTNAALMIALIQQLYEVEHDAADLEPHARRARRQERSVPLLAKIDTERQALIQIVLPKSPVGEAVRYLTNQWAALQRFVEDGRVAIDNNRAENQLRVVAVGRNYAEPAIRRSRRQTLACSLPLERPIVLTAA
jgi:TPP-dependent indolepyruvate ferredoxin oxidoreductase alpha subunit